MVVVAVGVYSVKVRRWKLFSILMLLFMVDDGEIFWDVEVVMNLFSEYI